MTCSKCEKNRVFSQKKTSITVCEIVYKQANVEATSNQPSQNTEKAIEIAKRSANVSRKRKMKF